MKKALSEIPEYYYYGPGRMWGKFLLYVPQPVLPVLGESLSNALKLLHQACKKRPDYLMNCVYFADALRKVGKKRAAEKIYRRVLSSDPGVLPEEKEENKLAIKRAKEKLESLRKGKK